MSGVRIIINADDFGQSDPVNEAVATAHDRGVLTSATIMANMPGFDEAVRIAKERPRLGVGVHVNLLRGAPFSDPTMIPSLVGRDGKFLDDAKAFLLRWWGGCIREGDIEREAGAQIARVRAAGLIPTHLDSEKHLHLFMGRLGRLLCRVAARNGIRAIRVVRETLAPPRGVASPPLSGRFKAALLNRNGAMLSRAARAAGLAVADRFYGAAMTGRMTAPVFATLIGALPAGSIEIMCHPAVSDNASADVRSPSWLDRSRVGEYRALLDPAVRDAIDASGACLIHYGDLIP